MRPLNHPRWNSFALVALSGFVLTAPILAQAGESPAPQVPGQAVPESKRTTLGLYLTATEAYGKWQAAPEAVKIVDVRTPEEFLFVGHPAMAWNVPVFLQTYEWDAEAGRFPMTPNLDFVSQVEQIAGPDDTILVMCRSGGRSARAADLLAEAGFHDVWSIVDGMEGDMVRDPESPYRGQRRKNGWKNSNLPWTYEIDPERMIVPRPH